jgi:Ca2+-binding RTX toxin-like protein
MHPSDPLYVSQWHFALIGDIETIWEEYDGDGVSVGVYDDGIDYNHPDLDGNYDPTKRAVDADGNPLNGYPVLFVPNGDGHGTSVAGLIAAEANNGIGGVGVAHGASVSAVNIFGAAVYGYVNGPEAAFFDVAAQATMFDISSNSWGATPMYMQSLHEGFAAGLDLVYADLSASGRDGLGTIIVQAAGNDDMDANADGVNVSRYTITVAATDPEGNAAWYSNYGASILIAAPGAEVTTDLQGSAGYDPGNYTTEFGGTSAATPITSAVIALMLEANPDLGWRDVQNILAASATLTGAAFDATRMGLEEDGLWQSNGATTWNGGGYHIHTNYGYGMINAFNAVRMAEVWHLFAPAQASYNERVGLADVGFNNVTVPSGGVSRTVSFGGNLWVEHVQLTLKLDSDQMMDLEVRLTSAEGTTITVAHAQTMRINPFDAVDGEWTFGIDALRGEKALGDWTITVYDRLSGRTVTVLESAELTVYGRRVSTNDVHHITDEYLKMKGYESGRGVIRDANGGHDWLDLAATAGDMRVDLRGMTFGTTSAVWGRLDGNFEHVVTGDGHDIILGNGANGQLYGMRGNDRLYGGSGNDLLDGGQGNDTVWGESGHDTLTGGVGVDSLRGGTGNDLYYYSTRDSLVETAGQGSDKVISDVTYGLAVNVEKLVLTGSAAIGGSGNGSANTIWGNSADNSLNGADGNDQLYGGAGNDLLIGGLGNDLLDGGSGNDYLIGGAGADDFRFVSAPAAWNVDVITDFTPGVDEIHLARNAFSALAPGDLSAAAFVSNTSGAAQTAAHRIIYEKDTGFLFYDRDGAGGAGAVKFAEISAGLTLTAADFFVF